MLYERLRGLTWKKSLYFKWKHDLEYRKHEPKKTEEELMNTLQVKSMNEYIKWENTGEYLELVNLLLATRFAEDLEKSYKAVSEKAHEGDSVSVKLMIDMQKFITATNKANKPKKKDTSAYDELEL